MNVLPARIAASYDGRQPAYVVAIDENGDEVTCRLQLKKPGLWRCSACGSHDDANGCMHTFNAALLLAEHLLGLTRAPEMAA